MRVMVRRWMEDSVKFYLAAALCFLLSACAAGPAQSSFDNSERLRLRSLAENGDKDSQYQLGNAYCCGTRGGFWDTAEAVKWWCKAAVQGQKDAAAAILRVGGDCADTSETLPQSRPITTSMGTGAVRWGDAQN
jgi:TPR repeat protein